MEDSEKWIKDCEDKEFVEQIQSMTSSVYDILEYKRSRSDKVTAPLVSNIKKAMDYILKKCTEVHTENKVMRVRLEDRAEYCNALADMAQKISRTSVSSVEETRERPKILTEKRREDYTIMITPNVDTHDVNDLKEKVKSICKTKEDLPTPADVLVTKNRQVIMKYRNKHEVDIVSEIMKEAEEVKDVAKISVPTRRRERVLLLSVAPEIEEEMVKKEVESQIEQGGVEDVYTGLNDKLESASLDTTTRTILEKLLKKPGREVRVVKKIPTKQGKTNWLLDVDRESKDLLLEKKRICIDYERYRVVEFVSITRCFKCQKFGHLANRCDGEIHCQKCAGSHNIKECKSTIESCSNCYFEQSEEETHHRADSTQCPIFIKYRETLIPKRS